MSLEDRTAHSALLNRLCASRPGLHWHPTEDPLHVTLSRTCSTCTRTWRSSTPLSINVLVSWLQGAPASKILRPHLDADSLHCISSGLCTLCLDRLSHQALGSHGLMPSACSEDLTRLGRGTVGDPSYSPLFNEPHEF